ncbi:hypothetical protein EB796_009126 [Bugula neritina]|uniref:MHD domain-containing protein n=1 Tax=Bugula neritina TaxID=10212 RepID=A0A7J7K2W6_BUGNE|nr:hypothetical protein EB796_009126 [Bugula neritina]
MMLMMRNYKGDLETNVIDKFNSLLLEREEENNTTPVIQTEGVTFAYIKHNNVYLVATTRRNANVGLVLQFLHKLANIFVEYFKELEEESIKDNFVLVYELLDEVMDFGLPQTTDRGKSKSVELEDTKFHQCVRLSRFENDRTISFIPPDGEFELMSYRLSTHVKPLIWVESIIERHAHSRVEYMIKAKSQFKRRSTANNVEIIIPVPNDADSPKFRTTVGSCKWVPENSTVIWTIKSFPGGKEFLMRAHFGLPTIDSEDLEGKPPIQVKFEIPYFTVSGIQVRYLKIIEKSGYQALPWVRYITQNGDYQLRTN